MIACSLEYFINYIPLPVVLFHCIPPPTFPLHSHSHLVSAVGAYGQVTAPPGTTSAYSPYSYVPTNEQLAFDALALLFVGAFCAMFVLSVLDVAFEKHLLRDAGKLLWLPCTRAEENRRRREGPFGRTSGRVAGQRMVVGGGQPGGRYEQPGGGGAHHVRSSSAGPHGGSRVSVSLGLPAAPRSRGLPHGQRGGNSSGGVGALLAPSRVAASNRLVGSPPSSASTSLGSVSAAVAPSLGEHSPVFAANPLHRTHGLAPAVPTLTSSDYLGSPRSPAGDPTPVSRQLRQQKQHRVVDVHGIGIGHGTLLGGGGSSSASGGGSGGGSAAYSDAVQYSGLATRQYSLASARSSRFMIGGGQLAPVQARGTQRRPETAYMAIDADARSSGGRDASNISLIKEGEGEEDVESGPSSAYHADDQVGEAPGEWVEEEEEEDGPAAGSQGGGSGGGGDIVHNHADYAEWEQAGGVGAVPGHVAAVTAKLSKEEAEKWALVQLQQAQLARGMHGGARRSPVGSVVVPPLEGEDTELGDGEE